MGLDGSHNRVGLTGARYRENEIGRDDVGELQNSANRISSTQKARPRGVCNLRCTAAAAKPGQFGIAPRIVALLVAICGSASSCRNLKLTKNHQYFVKVAKA